MLTSLFTTSLAALSVDPEIRGATIVVVSFTILCGSVYLLLATNTGAKLGFLLAAAGLTGWMAVMGWVWVAYGIGLQGEQPTWDVTELVAGEVARDATIEQAEGFPNGWQRLQLGDQILGDALASADRALIPATASGEEGATEPDTEGFRPQPPFAETGDYVFVGGYRKGGESYFIPGGFLERNTTPLKGWLHQPHYAIVQVQEVIDQGDLGGAPPSPVPDTSEPVYSVVMVRNLGSLRYPSFVFAVASTLLFALVAYLLHDRDKKIMAARSLATATA